MSRPAKNQPTASLTGEVPFPRDCVIFLPAMGEQQVDQTIDSLSRRIAHAFDLNAENDSAVFYTKVKAAEDLPKYIGEVGTVFRKDSVRDAPCLDIYKLSYRNTLIERYENRNLLVKTILVLSSLPGSMLRILKAMFTRRQAKTRAEKFQLLYALGILSCLVIYVAILFGALWATVRELPWPAVGTVAANSNTSQNPGQAANSPPSGSENSLTGKFFRVAQFIIVLSVAIGLFLPPKFNFKELVSKASVNFLCVIYYLNLGEQRHSIVGKLEGLVDSIRRKSDAEAAGGHKGYRNIHVIAYSFGSVIALDTFFPAERDPERSIGGVNTLVTIGCPFDFVRTFWPRYFDNRRRYKERSPDRWLNVYSPVDVLASNFRDDTKSDEANISIRSEPLDAGSHVPAPVNLKFSEGLEISTLSWTDAFTLMGLRAHAMYWGAEPEAEVSCFSPMIKKMYEGDDILA